MGTWGVGNFENDSALDYVDELAHTLAVKIDECLADEECSPIDEMGEAVIVPTVAILSTLHEHCHAPPPKPAIVSAWKVGYLAIYDEQIDDLEPKAGYKEERRQVIVDTFDKLLQQATTFWGESEDE